MAAALQRLASLNIDEGDLAAATKFSDEALAISRAAGFTSRVTDALRDISRIAIEKGESAEAERIAREALDNSLKEQSPDAHANAYETLAASLLAAKKVPEAREAIASALKASAYDFETTTTTAITAARTLAPASPAEALGQLQSLLSEASRREYISLAFDARLAIGEIEMRGGQRDAARAHLASLEKEAAEKGFGLIARKARAALRN
jgi:hypothetical protein